MPVELLQKTCSSELNIIFVGTLRCDLPLFITNVLWLADGVLSLRDFDFA